MIVASAYIKDGKIYTGKRHHNIIWAHPKQFFNNCESGFVTDEGKFLNRIEAAEYALACGQITELHYGKELFSEDLW